MKTATQNFVVSANGSVFGVYACPDRNAALLAYVHDAGYTSVDNAAAARDISMSIIRMEIASSDYERLSGRQLNARAAIHAALGSQDINRGTWRMDGGKVVTFKEAMERVMRAA